MTTKVLICDDSKLARKQMAASLPEDWDIEVKFAEHGAEALKLVKAGEADVMFIDLNMPVMDGYETLEMISSLDLPCMSIVVSGDIQPEANARVKRLGAIDFLKKPIDQGQLISLLEDFGLYRTANEASANPNVKDAINSITSIDYREYMQEASNVAMGQAADLLARYLNVFVKLPIPNVNIIDVGELEMALAHTEETSSYSAVCQGFIGSGISGESLLIFNDSCFKDMASLLNFQGEIDSKAELELLMEMAGILSGACINGLAEQIDLIFSQGHPVVLGQHVQVNELIGKNSNQWKQTLAIEINYSIENHNISCDLLLLFTEDSLDKLYEQINYLLN
ncbi:chemotaxis protein CheC [Oleiphilus sp. HI0009]|uniref:response regulator n=3 Tax=Oleiphilus TaxID=141450 RepID=UPI0007C28D05|nr:MULTISPECIES: response regulator [unclassified Oleiphilus]KZX82261.1 chemotaxis protein CheC [Oleiphilus sp. HI0009]MCH2157256.1 response regulator [Oleiphilaceae bacterium]KZY66719.1 chemotaxis protein CheC [Oleiphilus sp. HI0066]KZY73085.1 chemotaxis protein CheC [Oleiphilus sp. HI0067]KZZ60782.1 chemotaxis protein CheC [Oleiphilus sp. HI0125]